MGSSFHCADRLLGAAARQGNTSRANIEDLASRLVHPRKPTRHRACRKLPEQLRRLIVPGEGLRSDKISHLRSRPSAISAAEVALENVIGIDHAVVLVRHLDAAAENWKRLGFTVSPRG